MITFYGASWCPDCVRARAILSAHHIPHLYVNLETDSKAAETVTKLNKGYQRIPTILFEDGSILVEPSNAALLKKLKDVNLIE